MNRGRLLQYLHPMLSRWFKIAYSTADTGNEIRNTNIFCHFLSNGKEKFMTSRLRLTVLTLTAFFAASTICFNMASCKNLIQETASESAKTITSKPQPSFSAPACTRDHTQVKPQDDQNLSCASCHTKCVNIMHCKKMVTPGIQTNAKASTRLIRLKRIRNEHAPGPWT